MIKYTGGILYQGTDGEYTYNMNMCAEAWGSSCTGMLCQYALPSNAFVANIAYWTAPDPNDIRNVFLWEPVDQTDCKKGMRLSITNDYGCVLAGTPGFPRKLSINMFCDASGPELPTTFEVNEGRTCDYQVNFFTQQACDTTFKCQSAPCQNEGVCVPNSNVQGGYECQCLAGWTGVNCSQPDLCFPNPCFNEGRCTANAAGTDFSCECYSAYTGKTCQGRNCSAYKSGWKGWGVFCLLVVIAGALYLGFNFWKKGGGESYGNLGSTNDGGYQGNI